MTRRTTLLFYTLLASLVLVGLVSAGLQLDWWVRVAEAIDSL